MDLELLEGLAPSQLIFIAEHLKLGEEHLRNLLSEEEVEELFHLGRVSGEHLSALQIDKPESAGKVLLTLNSVATGILGVLLGYTELLGVPLNSRFVFWGILGIAFLLGAWMSYQNFQFTKKQAKGVIRKQQLNCLQLQILELLRKKKSEELNQTTQKFRGSLERLGIPLQQGEQKQVQELLERYRDSSLYEIFKGEIEEDLARVSKTKEEKTLSQNQPPPLFQKLLDTAPVVSRKKVSWFKRNRTHLAIGLIPTLLGGLGTSLSIRGQASRIAEEVGKQEISAFLENPPPLFLKAQLFFSLLITAYFAFSFFHENRKAFLRDRKREKLEESIIEKESSLTLLDAKLTKAKQAQKALQRLENILGAFKCETQRSGIAQKGFLL